jgi:hypothetical protein
VHPLFLLLCIVLKLDPARSGGLTRDPADPWLKPGWGWRKNRGRKTRCDSVDPVKNLIATRWFLFFFTKMMSFWFKKKIIPRPWFQPVWKLIFYVINTLMKLGSYFSLLLTKILIYSSHDVAQESWCDQIHQPGLLW